MSLKRLRSGKKMDRSMNDIVLMDSSELRISLIILHKKQTMKYGLRTILKTLTEILMTRKNSGHLCMRMDS